MIQRLFSLFAVLLAVASPSFGAPDATKTPDSAPADSATIDSAPRVAFWDPVGGTSDETLNLKEDAMTRVAAWMRASGASVTRLRVDEIADPASFSAQKFDVLVTPGEAFPAFLRSTIADFATGGVVMALSASEAPWSTPLVPDVNGRWRLQPGAKKVAPAPLDFGAQFSDFGDGNGTFFHRATPLLDRYLTANPARREEKSAAGAASLFEGFLPAPRLGLANDTVITPLVRSFSGGKVPVEGAPQIFLAQRGEFKALVVLSDVWSSEETEDGFQSGAALFGALCHVARDFGRATPVQSASRP